MTTGNIVFMFGIALILACSAWETFQPLITSDAVPTQVKTWKIGGLCFSFVGLALLVYERL
jgi:hypothetical protein